MADQARQRDCHAETGVITHRAKVRSKPRFLAGHTEVRDQRQSESGADGAAVNRGQPGVVHGMKSYLMQDEYGQVQEAHSISAGLDYPGVGPEHSYLASIGRAEYPTVTDDEVIEAFQVMSRTEGIIPALECAHAMAWIIREAPSMKGKTVLMNLSGRGDKDVGQMMNILGGLK
jgi:tryptophan synthase beta chain